MADAGSNNGRQLRFGVIGCGNMSSQVHCPNLNAISRARTVAYCDLDEARSSALLKKHGGDYTTTDYKKILADDSIDAVLIMIGPKAHPMFVQAAARAGKHVFVEKPLATELSDAIACMRAVEESGIKFVVGTCNRLAPFIIKAKELCPHPKYTRMHCASTVTHAPVHMIDLAVNLFHEAPLVRIYAQGGNFFGGDATRAVDSFTSTMTFADGTTNAYLQHFLNNDKLGKYGIELYDADRVVYCSNRYMELHLWRKDGFKQSWKYEADPGYRGPGGYMGHHEELVDLCDAIRTGRETTMPVRHAAMQVAVEVAIVESCQSNEVIDFPKWLTHHNARGLTGEQRSSVHSKVQATV